MYFGTNILNEQLHIQIIS